MTIDSEVKAEEILNRIGFLLNDKAYSRHHDFDGIDPTHSICVVEAKTISPYELKELSECLEGGKNVYLIINDFEGNYVLFKGTQTRKTEHTPIPEPLKPPGIELPPVIRDGIKMFVEKDLKPFAMLVRPSGIVNKAFVVEDFTNMNME